MGLITVVALAFAFFNLDLDNCAEIGRVVTATLFLLFCMQLIFPAIQYAAATRLGQKGLPDRRLCLDRGSGAPRVRLDRLKKPHCMWYHGLLVWALYIWFALIVYTTTKESSL